MSFRAPFAHTMSWPASLLDEVIPNMWFCFLSLSHPPPPRALSSISLFTLWSEFRFCQNIIYNNGRPLEDCISFVFKWFHWFEQSTHSSTSSIQPHLAAIPHCASAPHNESISVCGDRFRTGYGTTPSVTSSWAQDRWVEQWTACSRPHWPFGAILSFPLDIHYSLSQFVDLNLEQKNSNRIARFVFGIRNPIEICSNFSWLCFNVDCSGPCVCRLFCLFIRPF